MTVLIFVRDVYVRQFSTLMLALWFDDTFDGLMVMAVPG